MRGLALTPYIAALTRFDSIVDRPLMTLNAQRPFSFPRTPRQLAGALLVA
jgi:hypothetical protein